MWLEGRIFTSRLLLFSSKSISYFQQWHHLNGSLYHTKASVGGQGICPLLALACPPLEFLWQWIIPQSKLNNSYLHHNQNYCSAVKCTAVKVPIRVCTVIQIAIKKLHLKRTGFQNFPPGKRMLSGLLTISRLSQHFLILQFKSCCYMVMLYEHPTWKLSQPSLDFLWISAWLDLGCKHTLHLADGTYSIIS